MGSIHEDEEANEKLSPRVTEFALETIPEALKKQKVIKPLFTFKQKIFT